MSEDTEGQRRNKQRLASPPGVASRGPHCQRRSGPGAPPASPGASDSKESTLFSHPRGQRQAPRGEPSVPATSSQKLSSGRSPGRRPRLGPRRARARAPTARGSHAFGPSPAEGRSSGRRTDSNRWARVGCPQWPAGNSASRSPPRGSHCEKRVLDPHTPASREPKLRQTPVPSDLRDTPMLSFSLFRFRDRPVSGGQQSEHPCSASPRARAQ